LADNEAIEKLGKIARREFKAPNAKTFDEAREGELGEMGGLDGQRGKSEDLFAQKPAKPAPSRPAPSPSPEADPFEVQNIQEEYAATRGGEMSGKDAMKEALSRRKQKARPEVYNSKE